MIFTIKYCMKSNLSLWKLYYAHLSTEVEYMFDAIEILFAPISFNLLFRSWKWNEVLDNFEPCKNLDHCHKKINLTLSLIAADKLTCYHESNPEERNF